MEIRESLTGCAIQPTGFLKERNNIMSDESVPATIGGKSVDLEGLLVEKTESPVGSEASSNACANTSSDSNPTKDFKSSFNLSLHEPVVKSNEFNLADIRLSQDFESTAGTRKVITMVRVDKPPKDSFFRVRTGDDWKLMVSILEIGEDREKYIIHPNIARAIDLAVPTILYTAITRNGDVFFLPVKLPGSDGKSNSWNNSRMQAAELAKHNWVRMASNRNAGAYDIHQATGNIPEPEWPSDMTFEDLLKIAFKDRIIYSVDHPVLRKLRGEI